MATIFTQGRVCYTTNGRTAGSRVVVLEEAKNGYAIVEGPMVKKGKVNLAHLLPTTKKVSVPASYTKKDLKQLLEKGE